MILLIMNYQNLKNRQTTNLAVFERFLDCFCGYIAISLILASFHHQKLIILQTMSYQNLKTADPPIWWFWAVFVAI